MRNWLALLLLFPMCLFTMIGGGTEPSPADITTPTEEIALVVTQPTIEETVAETTEATTEETTTDTEETIAPTEVTTDLIVVETEPFATEPEAQDGGLISLGTFKLTAYCSCQKCCGKYALNRPKDEDGNEIVYGAAGVRLETGVSIAVDPRVIPYKSKVVINGHTYTAHDTGGGIKGNRIDVYFDNHEDAWNFGAKYAEVFIYA